MLIKHEIFESRSVFYNLEPLGIGTAHVESLTSYISRLAEVHNIKTSKFFSYLRERSFIDNTIGISSRSRAFNGNGKYNNQITKAVSELTSRKDINLLSLYDFSKYIYGREMRKYRAWCPACLSLDEKYSDYMYDRLLWNIDVVKICHIHNCSLETKCPCCYKENPVLSPTATTGYCHYCSFKLSETPLKEVGNYEERQFQEIIIKQIGLLLALNNNEREFYFKFSIEISEAIDEIILDIRNIFGLSLISFAQNYIKMPRTRLGDWRNGRFKPSLLNLIRLSYVTDNNIVDLLQKNISVKNIRPFPEKYKKFMVFSIHSTFSSDETKQKLNEIINDEEFSKYTFGEIAKMIGYKNGATLRDCFPEEHKILSQRRGEYLRQEKIKKEIHIAKMIENICIELISKDIVPTINKVESLFPESVKFFQLKYKDLYEKVILKIIKDGKYSLNKKSTINVFKYFIQ